MISTEDERSEKKESMAMLRHFPACSVGLRRLHAQMAYFHASISFFRPRSVDIAP